MDTPDKPPLDPYIYEQIEVKLHGIDSDWWKHFDSMSVIVSIAFDRKSSGPPPPKQPIQLKKDVQMYALMLFNEEQEHYPKDSLFLRHWLSKLAERTETRVMGLISRIEGGTGPFAAFDRRSLSYHGLNETDMRLAIREVLEGKMEQVIPIQNNDQSEPQRLEPTVNLNAEIERRKKLLAEYKAATGEPSDYQIYNAKNAGLYKAEFYKWKNGKLLSQSKTARTFESFIRAKKPPIPREP